VTVLLLTPLFKDLPEAVLAALIIHAVSHLWKVAEFRRYYTEARPEFWLGLLTLAGVITLNVLPGLVIDPLGSDRSHGCIRLANTAIDWLVRTIGPAQLPGTPVRVD
jgi:hypothetical protein